MRPFQWRLTVRQKTDSLLIVLSNTCSCVVLCRLSAVARELRTCKTHRLQNDDKLRLSLFMNVLADDVYRCISISIPEWERGGKSLRATTEVVHAKCHERSRQLKIDTKVTSSAWGHEYPLSHAFACAVASGVNRDEHLQALRKVFTGKELLDARGELFLQIIKFFDDLRRS